MKQGGISSASVRSRKWASILLLSLVLPLFLPLGSAALAQQNDANRQAKNEPPPRTLYRIQLELDFDARTYEGRERVRWVNRDDRPASVVYFHLYPNLRAEDERPGNQDASPESAAPEEPRLLVTSVRAGEGGQMLPFAAEDADGVTLRVLLREAVAPGAATELELSFKGTVPEIDPDETSLTAHVVQQVGAAMRDTREIRRARDTNFVSRGVMLLGGFHPVLAAREGADWQRKVEPSVGEIFFTDVADYEVEVETADGVNLFASCETKQDAQAGRKRRLSFVGEDLRGFALVAGRTPRAEGRGAAGGR